MCAYLRYIFYALFLMAIYLPKVSGQAEFIVEDIELVGLERVGVGTVFNYLPIKIGDKFDNALAAHAVRTLFGTGFFEDVQIQRSENVLVLIFKERPAISRIEFRGNHDLDTDELLASLKQIDFAEGHLYDRLKLDRVVQDLIRQYFSLGRYATQVTPEVTSLDGNLVEILINIDEGDAAKIQRINIIGNKAFSEEVVLDNFELTTPTWISFYTKSDQYSKQRMSADLESLQSFYFEHGYLNFRIDSTQVAITPDKKEIYITINITEGDVYTVSEVRLSGDKIVPEEEIFPLVQVFQGQRFSQKAVISTSTAISDHLGKVGYMFANVNTVPEVDEDTKSVVLNFFIDSGKRTIVRRILFSGNARTRDEVLRREMRQQESTWVSAEDIERGKIRLQRLGYFSSVEVETVPVLGTVDEVDVIYKVTESAAGNLSLGLGYSQTGGLTVQTALTQDNFLGSGKRISLVFNNDEITEQYKFGYYDPYFTDYGISRGFEVFYSDVQASSANLLDYTSSSYGASINFGLPISEYNAISASLQYSHIDLTVSDTVSQNIFNFISAEGNKFDILTLSTGFTFDTRDRAFFPESGVLHQIQGEISIPSFKDSLEFYKLQYKTEWLNRLWLNWVLSLRAQFSYGDGYGDTDELPFFENFYAGGPRSVRGFRQNTLGPVDNNGFSIGGDTKFVGNVEVFLPMPFLLDVPQLRLSGFVDGGNIFSSEEAFDLDMLRYSAGVGVVWVSPFGIIRISFAKPLKTEEDDRLESFQFSFGASF